MSDADAGDNGDDHDLADWDDDIDDDHEAVLSCPSCGSLIHEDAVMCPVCGDYVIHRSSPWEGKPLWWIVLGLLGIVALILVLVT